MLSYSIRKNRKIKWIICHYPVAPKKDAEWCKQFYINTQDQKSAHYAVSDNQTISIVACDNVAYHCATSNRKTYCDANNFNSIGIDLMDNKLNTKSFKVEDTDWFISERTLERAAELIAYLMQRYDIDINHVIRHYDVTHKWCPRPLMGDDVNDYYGVSGNERWELFKSRIINILSRNKS